MRSHGTTPCPPGLMPVYTIRFPGKLWKTLLDRDDVFSRIPVASRIAYASAIEVRRRAMGSTRLVDGPSVDLLPILNRLKAIVQSIHDGNATATQFGVHLRQLERCAHQMLIIKKDTP